MQNGDELGTMLPGSPASAAPPTSPAPAGPQTVAEPAAVDEATRRRQLRRRRRGRRSIVLLVALALVVGGGYGAYSVLRPVWDQLTAGNDYAGRGTTPVKVRIVEGASTTAIARILQRADVV